MAKRLGKKQYDTRTTEDEGAGLVIYGGARHRHMGEMAACLIAIDAEDCAAAATLAEETAGNRLAVSEVQMIQNTVHQIEIMDQAGTIGTGKALQQIAGQRLAHGPRDLARLQRFPLADQ